MDRSLDSVIRDANSVLIADGNLDAVADYFAPEYVAHGTNQDLTGGPDAVRRFREALRAAFPELDVTVEILVTGDNRIAWQRTLSGVQRGSYKGFPATGREVVWRDMVTSRVRDGLIAEDRVITDLAEQLLLARKRSD